jgi:hypothetical protein
MTSSAIGSSAIGSSAASFHLAEPLPAATVAAAPSTVAAASGTAFSTGFDAQAGATPDEGAALLILTAIRAGQFNANSLLTEVFEPVRTAIGEAGNNAARREELAVENAQTAQQIADLQQQLAPLQAALAAAQADLALDEKLDQSDPANQALVAAATANIATITASMIPLQQSLQQAQDRSASNTAQIAALETAAFAGFGAIANAAAGRLHDIQRKAATLNATVINAVEDIRAGLTDLQASIRSLAVQMQAQQRTADDEGIVANEVAERVIAAQQTQAAVRSSMSNPVASSRGPGQAELSRATPNQITPAIAVPPPVQTSAEVPAPRVEVPAPRVEGSADQENEQEQADRDSQGNAATLAAASLPEDPPRNPPVPDNTTSSTERAAVQGSIARGTAAHSDNDNSSDARTADMRAQLLKQTDRLIARLDRLVNQVNPSRPALPLDSQQKLASLLDLESPLVRRKILV